MMQHIASAKERTLGDRNPSAMMTENHVEQ